MKSKTIDLELETCLAAAGEKPVDAVFFLKAPKGRFLGRDETREIVRKIVGRAEARTSCKADVVSVFDAMQSFSLRGPASVVKDLARAREVGSTRLNRASQDLQIRPVSKRRVILRKT